LILDIANVTEIWLYWAYTFM